jgi:hypothetical protein
MNYPGRNLTLWVVALCVLLTMVVLPARASAQTTTSDAQSDTTKKHKKQRSKKVITMDPAAEPASAAPASTAAASTPDANSTSAGSASAALPKKTKTASVDSSSEIAAAQASGKVWVNLDSGIYHKSGRWYGKTKNGKFMTEAEAKAAGYKQSQRN